MRKLLAALAFLWLACAAPAFAENTVGPGQQVLCNKTAQASVASATTTLLITGVAGQSIFGCGWHVTSILATTSTFQFVYGTGATCGTGQQPLTPAFNVTSAAPSSDHISLASYQVPLGNNVCVITGTGTTGDAIVVYYSQF